MKNPLLISKGVKPRRGKVFRCLNCGTDIYRCPWRAKNFKRHFCSMKCSVFYAQKKAFSFHCVICQRVVKTQPTQMTYRKRKTCSIKCRGLYKTKVAEEARLSNPPTKHALERRIRYSKKSENWRSEVFKRDNYTCQTCLVRGGYLEAHHIKPFAYFPELRFDTTNGVTLCRKCHDKTKLSAKRMREIYGEKTKVGI